MLYLAANAGYPSEFVSCGNLVNENGFLHPKRNIDSFVFIIVSKGILHITQGMTNYDVKPNEFLLLFPNTIHYGYKASEGLLSYYWVHFYVKDPEYTIYNKGSLLRKHPLLQKETDISANLSSEAFFIPEYGTLPLEKRSHLLFVQLLDISKRENYAATWSCHYALSLLLLEVTKEPGQLVSSDIPVPVLDIVEWIRTHYEKPLTVASIAEHFNYHPTYLTSLFKKYTGYTILAYINRTRISVSKNLLINRDLSIYAIANMCGFTDDKYFMKLFKRYEGVTPTQYRTSFHQRKVNVL